MLLSKSRKWARGWKAGAAAMPFQMMQDIPKPQLHTDCPRGRQRAPAQSAVLAAASTWALRAAATRQQHTLMTSVWWQGKATSIMKNPGPYD